jgi:hypothetical protein
LHYIWHARAIIDAPANAPAHETLASRAARGGLAALLLAASSRVAIAAQAPPKQAVVETSGGTFVIDLDAGAAPNQTAYFMKLAPKGPTTGRRFTRVISTAWCRAAIR